MLVYLKDIRELLERTVYLYERDSEASYRDTPTNLFWRGLRDNIAKKTDIHLSDQTLYKSYWLKTRSHTKPYIGCSLNYLNALSKYVHNDLFLDRYKKVGDTSDTSERLTFPLGRPMFPASPSLRVSQLSVAQVWIKYEYANPTGLQVDRLSHSIFMEYNSIIREHSLQGSMRFPQLSLLSNGESGLSLQYLLRSNGLPNLKVLIDKSTPEAMRKMLELSRAEVYTWEPSEDKPITSERILGLTGNLSGLDATLGKEFADARDRAYDWMAYEILNTNPDYIFMPYGTGQLFKSIIQVYKKEMAADAPSRRMFGDRELISPLAVLAAVYAPDTELDIEGLKRPYDVVGEEEYNELISGEYMHGGTKKYPLQKADRLSFERALEEVKRLPVPPSNVFLATLALFFSMEVTIGGTMGIYELQHKRVLIVHSGYLRSYMFKQPLDPGGYTNVQVGYQ